MHDREHVISVVLTNEEWKAFLQLQPEPVSWLRERIQETIARRAPQASAERRQRKRRASRQAATRPARVCRGSPTDVRCRNAADLNARPA